MTRFDLAVHAWVVAHRTPAEVGAARLVTVLGSLPGLVVLTLLLAVLVLRTAGLRKRPLVAVLTVVTVAVGYGSSIVLKGVVGRPRPPVVEQLGPPALDPSFPSGHALSTTVLVGLAVLLWRAARQRRRAGRLVPVALVGLWLLVGASRVVLGYHWPSDVVGGWVIGVVLVLAVRPALIRVADPGPGAGARG